MEEEASNKEAEGEATMIDYEKQRLSRIRENEARLEALGLRRLAASPLLRPPSQPKAEAKRKQKKRAAAATDADEEYRPSDEGGEEDEESSSLSGEDEEEEESKSSSRSRKKGKKKRLSNSEKLSKNSHVKGNLCVADFVDDDVAALQQAIALSLAGPVKDSMAAMDGETSCSRMKESASTPHKKNGAANIQESAKNRKTKKLNKSKIQLTEDEVVAFFFSFDEVGKGYITPWDLERMAATHDFSWTEFEISKMIRCVDSDGDGRINLEDFRTIVSRCNMLQEPGE